MMMGTASSAGSLKKEGRTKTVAVAAGARRSSCVEQTPSLRRASAPRMDSRSTLTVRERRVPSAAGADEMV